MLRSPGLIRSIFLNTNAISRQMTAGSTKLTSNSPVQSKAPGSVHPVHTPIGPQSPQVPMPELTAAPFISRRKMQVATGPVIILVRMGGIHTRGFFRMLPICSMLVPSPCSPLFPSRWRKSRRGTPRTDLLRLP